MNVVGVTAYNQMMSESKVKKGGASVKVLKRVGKRISSTAHKPKYQWKYRLIDEKKTLNAWCLPGGKIAFYTGILPVLENEAGMAFVMGHEVGHATAHHGAERVSQRLALLGGLAGLNLYVQSSTEMSEKQRQVLLGAVGLGAEVGLMLPFSRSHEREADIIGLMYMAKSGYPPGQSIKVWDRMKAEAGPNVVPTFLSTHPSYKQRKATLKEWLPRARKRYQRNKLAEQTTKSLW